MINIILYLLLGFIEGNLFDDLFFGGFFKMTLPLIPAFPLNSRKINHDKFNDTLLNFNQNYFNNTINIKNFFDK